MEILLRDRDIVSMILEFLHSRQLYESAHALEKETGILPTTDEGMPDHLQYLRRLSIEGEWDNVLYYLEPFTELDEFNTEKLNYLISKQKNIEDDVLNKVVEEFQPYCATEDLSKIQGLIKRHIQEHRLAASRFHCFKSIMEVLGPIFELYGSAALGGEPGTWFYQGFPQPQHTRLESTLTDALFYDECCRYCRGRALKTAAEAGLPLLTTQNFESHVHDPASNAAVLFWLRSLKHDEIFRQRYEIEEVQVKSEPIKRYKSPGHVQSVDDSPKKFSSFASPVKATKQMARPAHPSLSRSVQMLQSERPKREGNRLASSGPAQHTHHHTRNFSNNNNVKNSSDMISSDETTHLSAQQNYLMNPPTGSPVKLEELDSENIIQLERKEDRVKPEESILDSKVHVSQGPEKPLRDSSNFRNTAPGQNPQGQIKVENSYDKFFEEQKRQKDEKEEFLRQLAEKEKKNDEIRKMLLDQQNQAQELPANPNQPVPAAPNQAATLTSDVNSNIISPHRRLKPFTESTYVPVEYTEDVQAVRAVAFHPSSQVYAVGSNSKTLRICTVPRAFTSSIVGTTSDPQASQELKSRSPKPSEVVVKKSNLHKGSIYGIAWNDEGSLIATCSNDKLIKLLGFDILGKTLDENLQELSLHRGIVREVAFMHESNTALASAGADGMVYVTDCKYKKNIQSLAGHTDQVLALYTWRHQMLASASQDRSIRLWDVRTPSCVSVIGTGGQAPCVPTSVCVDCPGNWLAVGLDSAKIGLYDLRSGKMTTEYKCHSNEVRCIRFNPVFENLLLSSSYDGTIVLTDAEGLLSEIEPNASHEYHWKRIAECKDKLIQCKWHPNGEAFASTSVDKTCKLWLRVDT